MFRRAEWRRANNPVWSETEENVEAPENVAQLVRQIAQNGELIDIINMISDAQATLKEYGENDQSIREIIQEAIRSLIHQIESSRTQIPDENSAIGRFLKKVNFNPKENKKWAKDALIYLDQMLSLVQNSQNEPLDTLVNKLGNYN